MKPSEAWVAVAVLLAASAAAFVLPLGNVLLLLALAVVLMRRRLGFLVTALLGGAANVGIYAMLLQGPGLELGPLTLSSEGARVGLAGAIRLAAAVGANLALLSRVPPEQVLDGLRLPAGATAFLAAVLVGAHDLGRVLVRLRDAARLDGRWPPGRLARIVASARLLPPLMVLAVHRGQERRDALRLAGYDTAPRFAALVAVTALACAGRLAVLAVPNDPVTYAVVFLGGLLFGAGTGALSGLLAMALTNVMISGLAPAAFANAPAMALLGLLGGLVGRLPVAREGRLVGAALAAACGATGVLLFSVAADVLTWALVPETRAAGGTLPGYVAVGLAFNTLPAVAAAIVFAVAVGPVVRAADAARLPGLTKAGQRTPPPS